MPNKDFDGHGNPNYVEYDIGPTTLAIGCAPGMWEPSDKGASACLEVEDLDEALRFAKEKRREDHQRPARISCKMFVIGDPGGNKITLHKRNEK